MAKSKTKKTLSKHKDTSYNLATKLAAIAEKHKVTGRRPVTAYRTKAEMTLAQSAPIVAEIQIQMLTGKILFNKEIFDACNIVLDRICGRAKQSINLAGEIELNNKIPPPVELTTEELKHVIAYGRLPSGNGHKTVSSLN